jgi:hypothetical protein
MSVLGQKQRFGHVRVTSALPPKPAGWISPPGPRNRGPMTGSGAVRLFMSAEEVR